MRKLLLLMPAMALSLLALSQDCSVKTKSLAGAYVGDCKKGSAEGFGTATGEDKYVGNFKSGVPNGNGLYTWKNGDWYDGNWEKGVRSGSGTMHYAEKQPSDSLAGFWKKDKYIGKYESPYIVHSKSNGINKISVEKESGTSKDITFTIESITGGSKAFDAKEEASPTVIPKPKITSIEVINGQYVQQFDQDLGVKRTVTTLRMVQFPFRVRITIDSDVFDIEILEEGKWTVEVKLQK